MPSPKVQLADEATAKELSEKLTQIESSKEEQLTEAEARKMGLGYMQLKGFPIAQDALALISEEDARRLRLLCFFFTGEKLKAAATDPSDAGVRQRLAELGQRYHLTPDIFLVSDRSLDYGLALYAKLPKVKPAVKGVAITEADLQKFQGVISSPDDLQAKMREVNTTDLITLLIAAALEMRASDIHVEAEEADVKVRYRIDGVLQTLANLEKSVWPQVIGRLKLVSGLKLNISGAPQDGRFTIFLTNDKVDVRVSTLPTAFGESVVMRLLKSSATGLSFDSLGIRGRAFNDLKEQVERPNGMIITTGPTGSGKTTTLYAVLNKLNDAATKIITLEDPVEYKLAGINQSQVDHAHGYGFADGLRSILRQDPDVVMVGEIRDLETADVAINAALTGHLVISTIHTNSAAGTIPRFLAMGVKAFLLAPALNAMIGQRLVRKICADCKEEIELPNDVMTRVLNLLKAIPVESGYSMKAGQLAELQFSRGKGCAKCHNLGFKGRIGIYEVLIMNEEIEKLVLTGQVSEYQMQEIGQRHGMITMVQDGLLKAADGITTVDEVFGVAE